MDRPYRQHPLSCQCCDAFLLSNCIVLFFYYVIVIVRCASKRPFHLSKRYFYFAMVFMCQEKFTKNQKKSVVSNRAAPAIAFFFAAFAEPRLEIMGEKKKKKTKSSFPFIGELFQLLFFFVAAFYFALYYSTFRYFVFPPPSLDPQTVL